MVAQVPTHDLEQPLGQPALLQQMTELAHRRLYRRRFTTQAKISCSGIGSALLVGYLFDRRGKIRVSIGQLWKEIVNFTNLLRSAKPNSPPAKRAAPATPRVKRATSARPT